MEPVKLIDIIGSKTAVSPRAGLKAYDYAADRVSKGQAFIISFDNVEDLTSAFCNSFIGKLYMNFEPQAVASLMQISGLDEAHVWYKKIKNAILLGTNENARTLHKTNLEDIILS